MIGFMRNFHKIDCYKMLTGEEYVMLALYYFYRLDCSTVNIFSDRINLYEEFIDEYNNFLQKKNNRGSFLSYVLNYNRNYIEDCIMKYDREPWRYSKPVIWKDRNKESYYINNLTESHRFELYVDSIFENHGFDIGLYYGKDEQYSGESKAGIEIKNDKESLKTGNIYIEYKERLNSNGIWVDSGILKNDNTIYWAIGNYRFIFFIRKSKLIDVMNDRYPRIKKNNVFARRGTSQGYIISTKDAKILSESIDDVIRCIKNLMPRIRKFPRGHRAG